MSLKLYKNSKGLTLIELLIVIILIGILAGIGISIINPQAQKRLAEDSVARQHLKDIVDTLEAFYTVERFYPRRGSVAGANPLTGADGTVLSNYLKEWPVGMFYDTGPTARPQSFAVYIEKVSDEGVFFKYNSEDKQIMECTDAASSVTSCN